VGGLEDVPVVQVCQWFVAGIGLPVGVVEPRFLELFEADEFEQQVSEDLGEPQLRPYMLGLYRQLPAEGVEGFGVEPTSKTPLFRSFLRDSEHQKHLNRSRCRSNFVAAISSEIW